MSISPSILAYEDAKEVWEQAYDSPRGIVVRRPSDSSAIYFRQRLYTYRSLNREENTKLYNKGDPLYGKSIYDTLQVRIDGNALYITKASLEGTKIEEL